MALLELKNLKTFFNTKRGIVKAVNDVSYSVDAGKVLGVVGESGSGKSVSAMSVLRLLDNNGFIESGEIYFDGKELTKLSLNEMYKIRGNAISVIFQEPMTSLNPVFTVSKQISEPLMIHQGMSKKEAAKKAIELLADVKIPNPEVVAAQYPHQLSGGMRQRVMIAMALACKPKLLIADEPTTALDVTIQAQILDLLQHLKKELNTAIILVTHDLGVIANFADRVQVMYAGQVVERGTTEEIFNTAKHPYTWALLSSVPTLAKESKQELYALKGTPPDLILPLHHCPFAARCEYCMQICKEQMPPEVAVSGTHKASCWLMHPDAPQVESFYERRGSK